MNIELKTVSIKSLKRHLFLQLAECNDESEEEDLNYQIFRLEKSPKSARLVPISKLEEARKTMCVQEGYWEINNEAHYICTRR